MVEEDHDEASKEEERSREDENKSSNHISYEASTGGAFSLEIQIELYFGSESLQEKNLPPPPSSAPPASHVDAVVTLPVRTGHDPGRSFCSREELAHCSRFQELEQGHKSGSASSPKLKLC